jgi:hypothetical protein
MPTWGGEIISFHTLDGGLTQATVTGSSLLGFDPPWWYPQEIGPSLTFSPLPAHPIEWWEKVDSSSWLPYIGLSTVIDGETHYGWVQIQLEADDSSSPITGLHVVDFAYESTPDTPITIGAVPAPGTLALLALGAAAGSRRKRIAA